MSRSLLLALTAGLIAFVVQSGELGSADTTHRLQTAHAWWTGEPEVFPYSEGVPLSTRKPASWCAGTAPSSSATCAARS